MIQWTIGMIQWTIGMIQWTIGMIQWTMTDRRYSAEVTMEEDNLFVVELHDIDKTWDEWAPAKTWNNGC
jgi:hypothetical protein